MGVLRMPQDATRQSKYIILMNPSAYGKLYYVSYISTIKDKGTAGRCHRLDNFGRNVHRCVHN